MGEALGRGNTDAERAAAGEGEGTPIGDRDGKAIMDEGVAEREATADAEEERMEAEECGRGGRGGGGSCGSTSKVGGEEEDEVAPLARSESIDVRESRPEEWWLLLRTVEEAAAVPLLPPPPPPLPPPGSSMLLRCRLAG